MSSALDYEKIAHLYDSYLRFTDDLPFFIQECQKTEGSVLELMCGTGRISIPLLEAGVNLTCVDASPAMLAIFHKKLTEKSLNASVIQANVTELKLSSKKVAEHKLPVEFSLIELDVFQELLKLTGFGIEEVFGNYDYSPFFPETSPYMIICSRKLNR